MKSTLRLSKLLIALVLLITSCQKDDGISNDGNQNENIPDTFSEYFGNEISRDFLGSVIDKDHNPIEGVSISIGSETAVTDSNGVFIIRDATVKEQFGYIKAEKAGYIHGSRSVVPSNGTNKVTIMLLEETVVGTVSSGSASTVTATDGSSVSFDGNFVKEDGTAYSGSVNVIMHHLDPTDDDMEDQMPGMLYAQNEDGAERMLQTLGMLAVELRGSSGEDLNLAEGSTSEIKIPVDATLLASAPATIPLWYFDEATGYWKEEGEATLQGNMYVGTVSHFSFWNCDIPAEAVILCVNLINEDGNEINNMRVALTSDIFGTTNGITNSDGEVCGLIPINDALSLNIYSNGICDNLILYSQSLGTFSSDSTIEIVVPNNPEITEDTVSGNFLTCDGENVTNGYILINYDGQIYLDSVDDGSFEISLYRCTTANDFTLEGIDVDNVQSSGDIAYNFMSPQTNVGNILSCADYQYSYIYYQIGNYEPLEFISLGPGTEEKYVGSLSTDNYDDTIQLVTGRALNGTTTQFHFLTRFYNFEGIGIYIASEDDDPNSAVPFLELECINLFSHLSIVTGPGTTYRTENFIGTAEIISLGEVGEFIELNFSGTLDIYRINPYELLEEGLSIEGNMRIIRKI